MDIYTKNQRKTPRSCYIGHRWAKAEKISGEFTEYFECGKCGKRKATQPDDSCYQPVDWNWLDAGV